MANCLKCGQPLREGAKFCGACGAKVEEQRFCTQCGAQLLPGDAFCTQCGAAAEGAPTPKCRGRSPKNSAASAAPAPKAAESKKPDYPDVRGFYGRRKAISVSDRALVWVRGSTTLSRLDKSLHLISRSTSLDSEVVQTKSGILLLNQIDYKDDRASDLCLLQLDDQLREQGKKVLCSVPSEIIESGSYYHYMTQFDLFVLQYSHVSYDSDSTLAQGISLRQVSLFTGETKEWKWDRLKLNDWTVANLKIMGAYGNKVYLDVSLCTEDDSSSAVLVFDTEAGQYSCLWLQPETDCYYGGRPILFDFEKQIMWTNPTQNERKEKGLKEAALVARTIERNAPILSDYPMWNALFPSAGWCYFDGQRLYHGINETFCAMDRHGQESAPWQFPGYHNGIVDDKSVLWNDYLIVELDMGNYIRRRRCYPATFEGPVEERGVWLDNGEAD